MNRKKVKYQNLESGQALILAVIVLGIVLINTLVVMSNSLNIFKNSNSKIQDVQATNLAEAGLDKAVASLNANPTGYNGENGTAIPGGVYNVVISQIDSATKL